MLDDSVPMHERILVPGCASAPHLMMEDIGVAAPLYDLCDALRITSVYSIPIELVPWTVPYPVGVPCPVIRYGVVAGGSTSNRAKGYIVVSAGGKTHMHVYGHPRVIVLRNVCDVSRIHRMGPRPVFSTPYRAVQTSRTHVGVLVPFECTDIAHIAGDDNAAAAQRHPHARLYDAETNSYRCLCVSASSSLSDSSDADHDDADDAANHSIRTMTHEEVDARVLPMCSSVLVKGWGHGMQKLAGHIRYGGSSSSRRGVSAAAAAEAMKRDRVYVLGKIVPPRECSSFTDVGVWVSLELRHVVGNLKNMPYADMITVKLHPSDLRIMLCAEDYECAACGDCADAYTPKDAVSPSSTKKRRSAHMDKSGDGTRSGEGGDNGEDADDNPAAAAAGTTGIVVVVRHLLTTSQVVAAVPAGGSGGARGGGGGRMMMMRLQQQRQ